MPAKVGIQSQGVECKMCNAYCCQGALLMASCNPNLVSMAWNGTHSSVSLLPQRNTLTSHKQAAGVRWHSEHPLKFGFCQPSCLQLRSRQPTLSGRCQPSSDHPCSSKTQPATVFFSSLPFPLQWVFHSSVALGSFKASLALLKRPQRASLWPGVRLSRKV